MNNLYKTIESLCSARNISITDMCRESGASRGSLTDLKKGRISGLHPETLRKIADYFGVSMDELYGHKEKPATSNGDGLDDATFKRKELANSLFANLSPEDQELALSVLRKLSQSQ